ncbi:MAG: hypothetical protein HY905_08435 [Deltaproteobacteria bacterium]|nr:hypothetical protein [Deltaproteobacteria bacterium]
MKSATVGALAMLWVVGCGDSGGGEGDGDGDVAEADGEVPAEDGGAEEGAEEGDAEGEAEDGEEEASPLTGVSLPQAIGGALWGNQAVYDVLPLHVAVEGTADAVTVRMGTDTTVDAADPEGDGDWVAMLPVAGLPDGFVELEATATQAGATPQTAAAELGLGRSGVQLTDFSVVGMAGVPRVHRVGGEAWVTWTDRSDGDAEAWLREIDGAARWTTDRVRLVDEPGETLYARTAIGNEAIGVLYQDPALPYSTHFKVTAPDGTELLAPMDLEEAGWNGSFGGDVAWDGTGFVAAWRAFSDAGTSEVRWMRVTQGTWEVTGPIVVATSGPGTAADPIGGFEPFSFIDLATVGELSLVGFVRGRYDAPLEMELPKSQVALLRRDGTIEYEAYAIRETEWTFDRECRVFDVGDAFVAVWSMTDLTDPSSTPPNMFRATRTDDAGMLDPARGLGERMFDAPDDRDEPFLLAHPSTLGVLAWLDHRAYTLDPDHGRIELYVAPVDDALHTGEETVFPHARFVAGTSMLTAASAGTNVLLLWIDERHGLGIMDPKPELYFETAWY